MSNEKPKPMAFTLQQVEGLQEYWNSNATRALHTALLGYLKQRTEYLEVKL